jgi:hypothetical protein
MADRSQVRFDLALDHSEYRGRLNFGSFRTGITLLIARIADTLREEKPIKVFHADHDEKVLIFGITAVTVEDEQPSVLVLGADTSAAQEGVLLQLLYLDHRQFEPQDAVAATGAVGDG